MLLILSYAVWVGWRKISSCTLHLVNGDTNEVRDSVVQKALSSCSPKISVISTSKCKWNKR